MKNTLKKFFQTLWKMTISIWRFFLMIIYTMVKITELICVFTMEQIEKLLSISE